MNPVIALVGRPNVGKSTLFNRLTKSRDALVADFPGLTRDRKYGIGRVGGRPFVVVDTGGLSGETDGIDEYMASQTRQAISEADVLLFLVDGREGVTAADEAIARDLRVTGKPVQLVVNKTDGIDAEGAAIDFYSLGMGEPMAIAAAHGRGINTLVSRVLEPYPVPAEATGEEEAAQGIRIAFIGRPNVGKSTLINRIMGEERVVAFDQPGTTRDSIFIPFERDGQAYTLIDTAGVRRRSRVSEAIEKFSVIKTLQAIEASNVAIMVLDAREGITEQDATLVGHVMESGKGLVVAINKWDGLTQDQREQVRHDIELKLPFLDFAEKHFISALHGTGVGDLYDAVQRAYDSSMLDVSTSRLTDMLEQAIVQHQPPLVQGRRIKLRYAHQGGHNPPIIVIHGNQTQRVPGSYKRYLVNFFRKQLQMVGTPIRVEFKTGENPYAGKRNKLTPRQQYKRDRMMRHIKRRKK